MWGGYIGVGAKTVLPSKANAKLTFRLVGKQNPNKILKAFQAFAKKHMMKDAKKDPELARNMTDKIEADKKQGVAAAPPQADAAKEPPAAEAKPKPKKVIKAVKKKMH